MSSEQALADLAAICRTSGGVTASARDGGLVIDVVTSAAQGTISLQGAQVLSWTPEQQQHDVLWCSPLSRRGGGKAIRGGIPICWPWFGPHATDPAQPQHGFARTTDWILRDVARQPDDAIRLAFDLPAGAAQAAGYSDSIGVGLVVVMGRTLDVALTTRNLGIEPSTVTLALHTYLQVAAVEACVIEGLDGAVYRDNTQAGRATRLIGPLKISRETIALFDEADARQSLTDPILGRRIDVVRAGGRSTIVWNPGAAAAALADVPPGCEAAFVCVESGAIGRGAVTLAPGTDHTLRATYSVHAL
jgi:glucose-6-phosphate 1-epimerase